MSSQCVKIAAWNIEDGLSRDDRALAIVERIKLLDADIVMLPEAFSKETTDEDMVAESEQILRAAGYEVNVTPYFDADGRKDRHWFAALIRGDVAAGASILDLSTRKTLSTELVDLPLTITGVHLDDRKETTRQIQAVWLAESHSSQLPNVFLGDFNAMHRDDRIARQLRLLEPIAARLPVVNPGEVAPNHPRLRRFGSLASRLVSMADGRTLQYLEEEAHYVDVDTEHQPTRGPVQLDHILTNFAATGDAEYLKVTDFTVHRVPKTESDHRPLTASIEY